MEYNFNAEKAVEKTVGWIRDWFAENGPTSSAVIGISGGKDSSVVAALCTKALGKNKVFGVLMPNIYQDDIDDAKSLVEFLEIPHMICDIGETVQAVEKNVASKFLITQQARINLPPRVRMTTLYAISQCLDGRVANTCNLSEDYIGYSTRYGDGAGDFSPLGGFTKTEVCEMGHVLGLPSELVDKTPSDGLCGWTDEENFGFTYDELDTYIREGRSKVSKEVADKIRYLHDTNDFKMKPIPYFDCYFYQKNMEVE